MYDDLLKINIMAIITPAALYLSNVDKEKKYDRPQLFKSHEKLTVQ
jgi:hypothetical protein